MNMTSEIDKDGRLLLKETVDLPEILDLLIIGGGPGGTTAAFHAKELGLAALVIDFDDVMKRIRDYPKDKLILPDFGGGDKMKFPKGGELINKLIFGPIDKDDMHSAWKNLYSECNVPAMIGVELTGLEKGADDVWQVKTWNHANKSELNLKARYIIIAIGRGVPRRFDIPGNTDGIAYRLDDAASYVGQPACVLGGGTSAAEAVLAISAAKLEADDKCDVCWSYRGTTMPRVSKALAEVFFEAHMNNGNIKYYPNSDAVAIVTAEDRNEYLSIRTDRRSMAGRPSETTQVEFRKECCIACIGEDIPESFLNSLGIYMFTGGPNNKKRMTVTKYLETQQPNIYMVGDILSQAYFETDDFTADPAGFTEIKHRGNIKSAMRDGVYLAKIIKNRLAGKPDEDVVLEDADVAEATADKKEPAVMATMPVETQGPPAASVSAERVTEESHAWLVRILPGNIEENEYALKENGVTTIGRIDTDITFPDDTLLSDQHASITHSDEGYSLRDDGSANGVFLKAIEGKQYEIKDGDLVKIGRQYLMFHVQNGTYAFTHYDQSGAEKSKYSIPDKTILVGRETPDITLDETDKTMSRRHLTLAIKEGKLLLKDLVSVNGTYIRVKNSTKLEHGTLFRVGQQLFCMTMKQDAVLNTGHITLIPVSAPPPLVPEPKAAEPAVPEKAPEAAPAAVANGAPSVTFKNDGRTFPIQPGQTICEIAEANGYTINAECHAGMCGSDPIRILSGQENLGDIGDAEEEALEDICELKPGECRLACMAKVKGPVEIEIIEQ